MADKLFIYIPTINRLNKPRTWEQLTDKWRKQTVLVCPPEEVKLHEASGRPAVGCAEKGIGLTRDWILKRAIKRGERFIVMLDDDVHIQKTRLNDLTESGIAKISDCNSKELDEAFNWMIKTLKEVPHCGFGPRMLSPGLTGEYKEPMKMLWSLAYDTSVIKKEKVSFCDGLPQPCVMEDYNITLQLLTRGYPNRVSLIYRLGAGSANAKGGCSTWRTTQIQTTCAKVMAKRFPEFVKVREKKAWSGMEDGMMDVTVYWRQALKAGQMKRNQLALPFKKGRAA